MAGVVGAQPTAQRRGGPNLRARRGRPERVSYGPLRAQHLDLYQPRSGGCGRPLLVLLHGGYWRARYTKRLMAPMAVALAGQGFTVANVEYRRVGPGGGGGGWPATFVDVAAAIDSLSWLGAPVLTVGHSAGGHLALWAAARHRLPPEAPGARPGVLVAAAVSLAGVVDLERAAAMGLGSGAVPALMGGAPGTAAAGQYELASPAALVPLGVPQVVIHGEADDIVPLDLSARYVDDARGSGDDATLVPLAGVGHMAVIAPVGAAWDALVGALEVLSRQLPGRSAGA